MSSGVKTRDGSPCARAAAGRRRAARRRGETLMASFPEGRATIARPKSRRAGAAVFRRVPSRRHWRGGPAPHVRTLRRGGGPESARRRSGGVRPPRDAARARGARRRAPPAPGRRLGGGRGAGGVPHRVPDPRRASRPGPIRGLRRGGRPPGLREPLPEAPPAPGGAPRGGRDFLLPRARGGGGRPPRRHAGRPARDRATQVPRGVLLRGDRGPPRALLPPDRLRAPAREAVGPRAARGGRGMSCAEFDVLLQRYLDGELVPADEASVREHAQGCPRCARELRLAAEEWGALVGAFAPSDAARQLAGRVRGALAPSPAVRWRRVAGFAAAAAGLAAALLLAIRPGRGPAPERVILPVASACGDPCAVPFATGSCALPEVNCGVEVSR